MSVKITGWQYNNLPRDPLSHSSKPIKNYFYSGGKKVEKWSRGHMNIESALGYFLKPKMAENEKTSKKEFLAIANLIKYWSEIVGKKYEKFCSPLNISFDKESQAKLTVAVFNPAVGFVIENSQDLILERIARLYGFKAIKKIIIKQQPKEINQTRKEEVKLSAKEERIVAQKIIEIEDKALAETLFNLGKLIFNEINVKIEVKNG